MSHDDGLPDEEGRPAGNRTASEEHAGAGSSTSRVGPTSDDDRSAAETSPRAPAPGGARDAPEGPSARSRRRTRSPGLTHASSRDPWWQDGALRALRQLVEAASLEGRPGVTVDELRRPPYALPAPHHPNAWGALPAVAAREGWLQRVGYVQSPAASRHASAVGLWRLAPRLARALREGGAR